MVACKVRWVAGRSPTGLRGKSGEVLRVDRLRNVGRWVLVLLAVVVGAIGGLAALLGTAVATPTPPVFLGVGLVVFVAITFGGVNLVTRRLGHKRRRVVSVAVTAASTLLVVAGLVFALLPLHDPVISPTPVRGQQSWELPTGSRIAYVKVPAAGPRRPDPIVFLHGGPGVADMAGDAAYFGQPARDGFDVWVYDQVGVGRSARLHDPTGYTVGREVADLEAIRQRIGAQRLILIGYSYGSTVAAAYLAQHPDHVERVVFSSPGPIRWRGGYSGGLFRLDPSRRRQLYAAVLQPRVFLAWLLVQANPKAAHVFAGDQELDRRFDLLANLAAPGLFCDTRAPRPPLGGLGAYANLVPQALRAPAGPDPRRALGRLRTPALIIKGSCDYAPWSSALDYRAALPTAQLVYLRGAGHQAYGDQPASYLAVVRAFLTGKQLPIAPYAGDAVPRDYEGPR
jgi:proline iminopeptidase